MYIFIFYFTQWIFKSENTFYDALDAIYVICIHNSNSNFLYKIYHPRPVMACTIVHALSTNFACTWYFHPTCTNGGGWRHVRVSSLVPYSGCTPGTGAAPEL